MITKQIKQTPVSRVKSPIYLHLGGKSGQVMTFRSVNYSHVYFYALESLPSNSSNVINDNTSDESENEDEGLGHMTYKPFKMDKSV